MRDLIQRLMTAPASPEVVDRPAQREIASAVAIGNPQVAADTSGRPEDAGLGLEANAGSAHKKLLLKRKSIPDPTKQDELIALIKQVRSQTEIDDTLTTYADHVTDGFRLKGGEDVRRFFHMSGLGIATNQAAKDLGSIGWCVVYRSEMENAPTTFTVMHNVTVRRGTDGRPWIFLRLTDEAKEVVKATPKAFPGYWSKEIDSDDGINITVKRDPKSGKWSQGGAYFISLGTDGEDLYPVPPLYKAIAKTLDAERIYDGVGTSIDLLKFYLLHAQVGNDQGQDMRDGRIKPVSKERVQAVVQQLNVGFKGGGLATPADINIKHSVPDVDPYTFHLAAAEILTSRARAFSGVPNYQAAKSEGVAAFLARSFVPRLDTLRSHILTSQFLFPLMSDMQGVVKGIEDARIIWSLRGVFELSTLMNVARFQLGTGGCSITYLNEQFDPDYEFTPQMDIKTEELKSKDVIGMPWEPQQGLSNAALESQAAETPDPTSDGEDTPPTKGQGKQPDLSKLPTESAPVGKPSK